MTKVDDGSTAELIPAGTEVKARVTGSDRRDVSKANGELMFLYKLAMVVMDGQYAGRKLTRVLWHSVGGLKSMTNDMRKLGHLHPEELCVVPLRRAYLVTARVGIAQTPDGDANEVVWFDALAAEEEEAPTAKGTVAVVAKPLGRSSKQEAPVEYDLTLPF